MPADLQGPLDEFYERMENIRLIVSAVESAGRPGHGLATTRSGVDFSSIGPITSNTVNAMAIVFLASSFEEFVREEISQCADQMADRYTYLPEDAKHLVRSSYWIALLEKFRFRQNILTKSKPRTPDITVLGDIRTLLDSARGFVVDNDSSFINRMVVSSHSNNFRPHVVDEIAARLGVKNLVALASDSAAIKSYFGVTRKSESATLLKLKLDEFYQRRNEIVRSISSATGYAVDVVVDYLDLFVLLAEAIKNALAREIAGW